MHALSLAKYVRRHRPMKQRVSNVIGTGIDLPVRIWTGGVTDRRRKGHMNAVRGSIVGNQRYEYQL